MPNSPSVKLADLTEALIRKTGDRSVIWETTTESGHFLAKLGTYILVIRSIKRAGSSLPDISISMFNETGQLIDEFTDVDLVGIIPKDYDGFYGAMSDLYTMASAQASGADKAIDDMLNLLK